MGLLPQFWIGHLQLTPHPEGGFFREVYRSEDMIAGGNLPTRYSGERSFATSIYFLLEGKQFSAFHRIRSDETWHFYTGCPLKLMMLDTHAGLKEIVLGPDPNQGEVLQYTISRNTWFAARPVIKESYSLVGCSVAPGFNFDDFELAESQTLINEFPAFEDLIRKYCRT